MSDPGTLAVSLGRAFAGSDFPGEPVDVATPFGPVTLHRLFDQWLLFRHGKAYDRLPHRIAHQAHVAALHQVGVRSLLATGFVHALSDDAPLHQPVLVSDVAMPNGLLPSGGPCTMYPEGGGGYLAFDEGPISRGLVKQLRAMSVMHAQALPVQEVIVDHIAGPRERTAAETRRLVVSGVTTVSMTIVPEILLANEVGISVAAVVVGTRTLQERVTADDVDRRLAAARPALETLCATFLRTGKAQATGNRLERFGKET